ncbi:hypothetical protein EX895_005060 [Sporisorium graminicola]|uniref:Apple domain-containing protein n=1 Tax=Sporisorium graminicola TaxID=280036 RepID=A0A4U7KP23_9BASI|nr:hypothetical protein EX895_005060 [Sporisorium graminicola]TKY86235.1 hypothetical protein EX895_005060 [Sporisorium graminicola]
MSANTRAAKSPSPHVVVAYRDADDDEQHDEQRSSLLPSSGSSATALPTVLSKRTRCWKRLILCVSVLAVCVGIFETVYQGKEAESLQAAKAKISQLEQQLSTKLRGGFDRVMATIAHPTPAVPPAEAESSITTSGDAAHHKDAAIEAVKSSSVIVLKTGASVSFERLPVQLLLAQSDIHPSIHLSGTPHYTGPTLLIYSDASTQLGTFTVHDAFVNVSTYARNSKEFGPRYTELHSMLASSLEEGGARASGFTQGWNLDKWKFLYMWQDAYRRRPDAEWYIGYEADTYVLWDSLFRFLAVQDPQKEQLFGCGYVLMTNQETFANGGCPYVVSGALMRNTFGKDAHFAERFDSVVERSCCGDAELSIALRKSATVPLQGLAEAGARFQREPPREILYDEGNWCQPVFSFHHLSPDQITELSRIQRQIRRSKPPNSTILYSDWFDHISPHALQAALHSLEPSSTNSSGGGASGLVDLNPSKANWEAFAPGDRGVEVGSQTNDAAQCKHQCIDRRQCTAWVWSKVGKTDPVGKCLLMLDVVRIGHAYEGNGMRTSGWVAKHIVAFKAEHECKDPPSA